MPLYYAQLEGKKPYTNRFRQMVVVLDAEDVELAEGMLNELIQINKLNAEIIELYKDENATAF